MSAHEHQDHDPYDLALCVPGVPSPEPRSTQRQPLEAWAAQVTARELELVEWDSRLLEASKHLRERERALEAREADWLAKDRFVRRWLWWCALYTALLVGLAGWIALTAREFGLR